MNMVTTFPPINSLSGADNLSDKERELILFLYEEGPHIAADVIEHLGYGESWSQKALNSLMHQGIIERARIGADRMKYYWIYREPMSSAPREMWG